MTNDPAVKNGRRRVSAVFIFILITAKLLYHDTNTLQEIFML